MDLNREKLAKLLMFAVNALESGLFINHSYLEPWFTKPTEICWRKLVFLSFSSLIEELIISVLISIEKKNIYIYITFIKAQVSNVWNLRVLHFW